MFVPFPPELRRLLAELELQKASLLNGWRIGAALPEGHYELAPDGSGVLLKTPQEKVHANESKVHSASKATA